MENKYIALKEYVEKLVKEGICIAFSGGVDSSLILKVACEAGKKLNKEVYAITFESRLHPASDVTISKRVAQEMGARHKIIQINEFENEEILKNPENRCYLCKESLFSNLQKFAQELGCKYVVDGTNADDLKVYRPGIQALKELGIVSPLAELDITKAEVRGMASSLNISVSSRPSAPCMATRLPYNTPINFELLEKIEKGEEFIKGLGFRILRLRVHGDIVRIEVPREDLKRLLEKSQEIIPYLKDLGFVYITMDLEGFRSGSMDVYVVKEG
ncbi:ATP-dependent sacrificial sulfur transferase LarE [Irregularibacter muris]|uniref:ATP-dependent sacrificial sulfur transferase LarE n=1 Tax=Irregularibacter muris TaxID=1796619 RepID=A0AAE3L069_9FIRM|nr:ATP-dependent sacrificial sulfur transferase LarE [Irregularibacter muris]MCR1899387.1 ATP-dependent sacrificial sulfur transferase LarE [Irregularibacter muris]